MPERLGSESASAVPGAGMAAKRRPATGLLLVGLLALWSPAAGAEWLYINTYGSDWGLWVRGHCLLEERDGRQVLELEEVALEPNRRYPQALEVAGFRLAASYLDVATGEPLGDRGATGPEAAHAISLAPGEKQTVRGLVLELPRLAPPRPGELRLLLLQVVMASGTAFAVEVTRTERGSRRRPSR